MPRKSENICFHNFHDPSQMLQFFFMVFQRFSTGFPQLSPDLSTVIHILFFYILLTFFRYPATSPQLSTTFPLSPLCICGQQKFSTALKYRRTAPNYYGFVTIQRGFDTFIQETYGKTVACDSFSSYTSRSDGVAFRSRPATSPRIRR